MPQLKEIRKNRIEKLKMMEKAGVLAYPLSAKRTHLIDFALKSFSELEYSKKEIILCGRLRSLRDHGSVIFADIEDGTAKIQLFFKKNRLDPKRYEQFLKYFDIGDFIEVRGTLFKTKKGEKTIEVADYKMLAKTFLPLPEKWHGLKDVEERYRKRYLDLIFNKEVKEKFKIRSKIIQEIGSFLKNEEFLEVETPILQPIYGGTNAKPFKTHLKALDMDLYLRIAHELYLKRLLVGGFEKVYEIGRMFRNEGMDRSHNPEFTMLDFYWAYADYKDMMRLTERMFKNLLKKVFNSLKIEYQGKEIDFKTPWTRIEFTELLRKYTKINFEEIHLNAFGKEAQKLGVEIPKGAGKIEIADEVYKKFCRSKIWQPTFVIHHPVGFQPLAKQLKKDSNKLANFQLVIGGCELGNAFSELNDPMEQRKRFEEQEKSFKDGLEEAQRMDEDFLEALEYGMPPATGFGLGIDRLVTLLTDSHSLREVILFPTMRSKK